MAQLQAAAMLQMHAGAAFPGTARRPALRAPARRRAQTVPAAVQRDEQQQQQQRGSFQQPPAAPQQPVRISVFETKDAPAPAPGDTDNPLAALLSQIDMSEPMSFDGEEKTEYDPLRDGPLRYLGYANELGEAFAAWLFTGGVPLSYAVAIGYVCFDTVDKYRKTLADARAKLTTRALPPSVDVEKLISTIGLERGLDTLVWQLIASVAAPGYTIHTVVALVSGALARAEASPQVLSGLHVAADTLGMSPDVFLETFNKSVPTACGLLAIPFIVHPIDGAVHALLNATLRPLMRRHICSASGGTEAGLAICRDCKP